MDVLETAGSEDGLDNPALVICPSRPSTAPRPGQLRGDVGSRPALFASTCGSGPPGGDSVLVTGAGSGAKRLEGHPSSNTSWVCYPVRRPLLSSTKTGSALTPLYCIIVRGEGSAHLERLALCPAQRRHSENAGCWSYLPGGPRRPALRLACTDRGALERRPRGPSQGCCLKG